MAKKWSTLNKTLLRTGSNRNFSTSFIFYNYSTDSSHYYETSCSYKREEKILMEKSNFTTNAFYCPAFCDKPSKLTFYFSYLSLIALP